MALSAPDLSVIIPAYNEEKRLGPHLDPVFNYLKSHYPDFELILVDDGSTDATKKTISQAILKKSQSRLISYFPNRGKGYAVRQGVMASRGQRVLFMDADLSTPLSEIPRILKLLENSDIVIGSRRSESKIYKKPPFYRQVASFIFDQIKYLIVGLRGFEDTQCGFKAFRGDIARKLFSQCKIDRFMFDVEVLYLAKKSGFSILEMPVSWADVPDSHVRFWEGTVNMFRDLWRIRKIHS